ncbi:hypothetical protein NQ318_016177 [Aromia moschata]|uniref:B box-type domain-containing protein n=1 Tax=Aromia moschata TaxID=1265417 RepID=A0AAV8X8T0_9CUCU|nr:hypothetical protein NQ318_016177 [Aromia moschata]
MVQKAIFPYTGPMYVKRPCVVLHPKYQKGPDSQISSECYSPALGEVCLHILIYFSHKIYPTENPRPSRRDVGASRLIERHFPEELPRKKGHLQRRRCIVCAQTKNNVRKRKETRFMCKDCDVGLCIPCFRIYHEERHF